MANKFRPYGAPITGKNVVRNNIATFSKWLSKQNQFYLAMMRPTNKQKKVALAQTNRRCMLCGATEGVELHHNIRRKWGIHDAWNLWPLCKAHHRQMMHHHGRDGSPFMWPSEQMLVTMEEIAAGVTQEIKQAQINLQDAGELVPEE